MKNKLVLFILCLIYSLTSLAGNSALIVMDMQKDFVEATGEHKRLDNAEKVEKVIQEQLNAIKLAKRSGVPILLVSYKGNGAIDSRLINAVNNYEKKGLFQKNSDSLFSSANSSKSKVNSFLSRYDVKNLVFTGANGGGCVRTSISDAIKDKYNAIAYSNGIADFNRDDFVHPYSYHGRYEFRESCVDCIFRETSNINDVNQVFKRNTEVNVVRQASLENFKSQRREEVRQFIIETTFNSSSLQISKKDNTCSHEGRGLSPINNEDNFGPNYSPAPVCYPDPSCDFYFCQENKYGCGKEGVFQRFANKVCNEFMANIDNGRFSVQGAKWVYDVTLCLQKHLYTNCENGKRCSDLNREKTCEIQEKTLIETHRKCYKEAGLCDLNFYDKITIFSTVDVVIWDFMSNKDRIKNVLSHLTICL